MSVYLTHIVRLNHPAFLLTSNGWEYKPNIDVSVSDLSELPFSEVSLYLSDFPQSDTIVIPPLSPRGYISLLKYIEESVNDIYLLTKNLSDVPSTIRSRAFSDLGLREFNRILDMWKKAKQYKIFSSSQSIEEVILLEFQFSDLSRSEFLDILNLSLLLLEPSVSLRYRSVVDTVSAHIQSANHHLYVSLFSALYIDRLFSKNLAEIL